MDLDPELIRSGLILVILFLVSICFHEWGHALASDLLGDDTPRSEGRLTLNPMSHADLFGTILIPLLNIVVLRGGFGFIGWGRPVNTNPANYKNRVRDDILVSLAGPLANLVLALAVIVLGSLLVVHAPRFGELVQGLVGMNVGLAVFNLLPIPPLDGGTVLKRLSGMSEETYIAVSRWSGLVLLMAINFTSLRVVISVLYSVALSPYALLSHWINPTAFFIIFQS